MSMSDYYDQENPTDEEREAHHHLVGYWRTRAGEIIPVGKLTDSHLHNILRMLKRKDMLKYWPWVMREIERRDK